MLLLELEKALTEGRNASKQVQADIKVASLELEKKEKALALVDASLQYAREQIKYLKSTNECVSFEEFVKLRGMEAIDTMQRAAIVAEIERLRGLITNATAVSKALEDHIITLALQVEDHDNIYFLEDYQNDYDGSAEQDTE